MSSIGPESESNQDLTGTEPRLFEPDEDNEINETLAIAEQAEPIVSDEPSEPKSVSSERSRAADIIGSLLIEASLISAEQLRRVRRIQDRLPNPTDIVSVLEELRIATREDIREALKSLRCRIPIPLGLLLVELAYIREAELKVALSIQKGRPHEGLGSILVSCHSMTEDQLVEVLSIQLGIERVIPSDAEIDPQLWQQSKWLRAYNLVPIGKRDRNIVLAFADPLNSKHVEAARRIFGKDIIIGLAGITEIHEAIDRLNVQKRKAAVFAESDIVETVNQILKDATASNTSDIHIEPQKHQLQVRFRQDGVLVNYRTFPLEVAPALTSRLKVMAKLDIAEKRRHQDGRMYFDSNEAPVDLRISTYVSVHGETVVLRILNTRSQLLNIRQLGMGPRMLQSYVDNALDAPSGVVIITGPTGSGKTTTLYSSVHYLNRPHTSIITAEDPVEYVVDGVTQCSINPRIGLTFEDTLKSIVRQDPDVIVIGEIRDTFSAETAIQAALTGHKILTTFHTEDSIGGVVRLLNMEIEAFLVSSTVVSVLAQRLIRRICPHCFEEERLGTHQLSRLGYELRDAEGLTFRVGRGCKECYFTGYRGRVAVFELLTLNQQVKDAILLKKTSYEIRRLSTETTGLVTLLEDAIYKAVQGMTTFEEIIRTIPRLGKPRHISEIRRLIGEVH
jgi:type IV pilus assembly protein PilB